MLQFSKSLCCAGTLVQTDICCLLRRISLTPCPGKVDNFPEVVDSFPKNVDLMDLIARCRFL